VRTRFRDVLVTLAVLAVLFGMLVAVNPQVREGMGQMAGEVQSQQWNSTDGTVGGIAEAALSTTSYYASENPILFAFVIVAAVLFVAMLRT
jgi:hypothetical protein